MFCAVQGMHVQARGVFECFVGWTCFAMYAWCIVCLVRENVRVQTCAAQARVRGLVVHFAGFCGVCKVWCMVYDVYVSCMCICVVLACCTRGACVLNAWCR